MARTPLFRALKRALAIAHAANRPGAPPADELPGLLAARRVGRRRAMKSAGAFGLVLAGGGGLRAQDAPPAEGAPAPLTPPAPLKDAGRIAIVGGGVAGLNAAYTLQKAGVKATVYEGARRLGGRMFSAKDQLGDGLITEIGGEFIDSGHEDMLNLCKEFGLELIDVFAPSEESLKHDAFFFGGRHYTEAEVVEAFRPIAPKMAADAEILGEEVSYANPGQAGDLDRTSIAAYLDKAGATGWFRSLLDVAFVTEYGLDADEQSCINLLFMIGTDLSENKFQPFGDSDERYKVVGGNQRVTDELAKRLKDQIKTEHKLLSIKPAGAGYKLAFQAGGGKTVEAEADVVILAIPFTLLREVEIGVELPEIKKKVIAELGYGMNAKVMAGFKKRLWREQGYGGNIFTDEPFQLGWDNTRLQPGETGGLTFYSGGKAAMAVAEGKHSDQAKRLMQGAEKAYPGVTKLYNGRSGRFHWPTHPWTKMAYACYKPGQWTTIGGAEIEPVGNLLFAGEHCSVDYQGYMNGGAETGRRAAESILEKLKA